MSNPFIDRLAAAGKNPHGRKSERHVAKKMGARQHANSGAPRGSKSDASTKQFRIEMKSTVTQAMMLEMAWLVKIAQEALAHGQVPMVTLSFVDANGLPRLPTYAEWVVIPMTAFKELTE